MNIAVCDYGAGNLRSVVNAFRRLGETPVVTSDPEVVLEADLAVLPGVGAAGSALSALRAAGVGDALRSRVLDRGKPTLGICLGLQVALEASDEDGGVRGLGLVPGRAERIAEGRVPRIGWAPVDPDGTAYYFAHSYAARTPAAIAHSEGVVAAVRAGSFTGVQYHPEKSGPAGARYLERCLSLG
ncbi:MAG: imidazole glycerol phosphate synthase subunit HisH [Actinobacteria bacterium]|nr:imidazole glycerol phosphate synthase subunit HisH [Actinomycetota bacterium]